jgi:cystathionine beta-lyase
LDLAYNTFDSTHIKEGTTVNYHFDQTFNRRATDSIKWEVKSNELPMWIADMDFPTAPEIVTAMQEKVRTGIFGYEEIPADYFRAVANWYAQEHHFQIPTEWMLFAMGVMPATSSIIRHVTNVGDNVLVQAPVYNMFWHTIESNGRHVVSNDLTYNADTLAYSIDFLDLAEKLADPATTLMILCNPHNPIGKVWSRNELMQIAKLCLDNHVTLLSDEIHGDLTLAGHDYIPINSLPPHLIQHTIATIAPSKTFNLAGLHASTVVIPNPTLRATIARGLSIEWLAEPNLLSVPGTIAAYTHGGAWLHALKDHVQANIDFTTQYLAENIPAIKVVPSEATYLLWLDCRALTHDSTKFARLLREKCGLVLSAGADYGAPGRDFLRMNVACPRVLLVDGLKRLKDGVPH